MATNPLAAESRPGRAAVVYFALVFGCGFLFGVPRTLWLVPKLGERLAELLEAPLMLVAIVLAGGWVVGRFQLVTTARCILAGVGALSLLLLAEAFLVLELRGISLARYVESRDPVSGSVYLAMLVAFAAMPALLRPLLPRVRVGRRA